MKYGNVLVIGNSGVGKSTLINAVLGEDTEKKAPTSIGISGTTKELEIFESEEIPFRVIDTIGFEPSFFKRNAAVNAVKRWSKESAKEGGENKKVNVIWFCVEGTSSKLFPDAIKSLSKATSFWESVPVIVVITKSYSMPDRKQNIQMVHNAFAAQKKYSKNLKAVVPVVAETFILNDTAFAAPEGISELIEITNSVMPEGIRAAEKDISRFKLQRKRALAQSVVAASVAGGTVAGAAPLPIADAAPLPIADAAVLSGIEVFEINAISRIYEVKDDKDSEKFVSSIIEAGTASAIAKATISAIKAIPGINLAASAINAIIAASFVAAIGGGSIYAFEKIYLGERTIADIDWVKKVMESELSNDFIDKVKTAIEEIGKNGGGSNISKTIADVVLALFSDHNAAKKQA